MSKELSQIILRKIVDLDGLHDNPRFIRDDDFKSLCASIKANPEHLNARPLIISNRTGLLVVIAGNMRLRACVELGVKEVPTIILQGLTEDKEREIIIRDNVNNGNWDYDTLANNWDKDLLIEWGVPALWDLEDEEEPEKEKTSASVVKLTIEFDDLQQHDQFKAKAEIILADYPGASIK